MDNKRKYPMKLFIFGVISNLIRKFYIGALVLLFLIIGIFNNYFTKLSVVIFCLWVMYAIVEQIILRHAALKTSSNEQYNHLMDTILGENGPFSKSENKIDIKTIINDSIRNNHLNDD
ncbi:MAG: hypothetical protein K0S47_3684 [Herbinix sp.]|nr:hypothetical protein [Herbinix sp.]